jgi:hypothetical protein
VNSRRKVARLKRSPTGGNAGLPLIKATDAAEEIMIEQWNCTLVSRDEVTTALQVEIATVLAGVGMTNPFIVSPAAPWAPKVAR